MSVKLSIHLEIILKLKNLSLNDLSLKQLLTTHIIMLC